MIRAFREWLLGTPSPATPLPQRPGGVPPGCARSDRALRHRAEARRRRDGRRVLPRATNASTAAVAIKMMPSLASDETARQRFWREARAAASVNHPNVCQIYEIGEDGGELFIAMELLEGEPLAEQTRARAAERRPRRCRLPSDMLAALSALHHARHRPPRSQAVERVPHSAWRQAARLRAGAARSSKIARSADRPDAHRHRDGDAAIHGARTDHRRSRRCPHAICLRPAPSCSRCWPAGRRSAADSDRGSQRDAARAAACARPDRRPWRRSIA